MRFVSVCINTCDALSVKASLEAPLVAGHVSCDPCMFQVHDLSEDVDTVFSGCSDCHAGAILQ